MSEKNILSSLFHTSSLCIETEHISIRGLLFSPQTDTPGPAVIFSHGYNGSHQHFTDYCQLLAAHGITACCYDFCGGSASSISSGSTTEMSVLTEQEDLLAVLNHVRSLASVDPNRIYLFGESQGGYISAFTAAAHSDLICGLMLLYPAFCIPDDWTKTYPDTDQIPQITEFWGLTLGACYFRAVHNVNPFEHIHSFEKPVLLFHGTEDSIVALSYAERARDVYKQAKLVIYPGEGHGFSETARADVQKRVLEFVH